MPDETLEALKQFVLTEEVILQGSRRVIRRKHVPQGGKRRNLLSLHVFCLFLLTSHLMQARGNLLVLVGFSTKTLIYV